MKHFFATVRKYSSLYWLTTIFVGLSLTGANAASLAGQWLQTGSNAGYCGDCSVTIERTSNFSPMLKVTANNGWSAQVTLSGYGTETAHGFGRWDRNVGGHYAGHSFEISIQKIGETLKMKMQHLDNQLPSAINATFSKRSYSSHNGEHLQSDNSFPYQAASWGGIVRAGPGMHFERITSLFEQEDITIIARTGEIMNGYPWMEVQYRNNHFGYQWGGIICATDYPRTDLHELCHKPQQQQNVSLPLSATREIASYQCNDGTTMDIRLDNRAAETLAVVERNGLTDYLVQIVSASGSLYSNGIIDLHTKADFALLSSQSATLQCQIMDDLAGWAKPSIR